MSTTYMTVKLNLSDGTIVYPQVSLDNIVTSISDPTLVQVATLSGGTISTTQLPVVTTVGNPGANTTIPTEAAVRSALATVAGTATPMTTAARTATTPASGALIWDTNLLKLFVGDGSTAGGVAVGGGSGGGTDYEFDSNEFEVTGGTAVALKTVPEAKVSGLTDLQNGTQSVSKELTEARFVEAKPWSSAQSQNTLTILHFSDIHADANALGRILAKAGIMSSKINAKLCTGDIVQSYAGDGYRNNVQVQQYVGVTTITDWWDPSVMIAIGNHDCANSSHNYTAMSMANRDANYIAPFASGWGITHTSGTSYYYKDFTTQKVRLIVLDCVLYNANPAGTTAAEATAQTTWLDGLLASAITSGLHVVIAAHASYKSAVPVQCSFSKYKLEEYPLIAGTQIPLTVLNTVKARIAGGLQFVGYIVGHYHQDSVWDALGDRTQMVYTVTCAAVGQANQWQAYSDQIRNTELDAFNLVTIDTTNKRLKIVRGGGANIDCRMRKREAICVDYATNTIIDWEYNPEQKEDPDLEVHGGWHIGVDSNTVSLGRYVGTEVVTGTAAVIQPGFAYKIKAQSTVTLYAEALPTDNYGLEGMLDVTLDGGTVTAGPNVIFTDTLTADKRNICTVRYLNGKTIVSVLTVVDDIAQTGYITLSATGTADGSLYYGLATSAETTVSISPTLDGQLVDMGNAVTNKAKNIVGTGYGYTKLTGGVSCTSATTFSELSMVDATLLGGTMTMSGTDVSFGGKVTISSGFIEPLNVQGSGTIDESGIANGAAYVWPAAPVMATNKSVNLCDVTISGTTGCRAMFTSNCQVNMVNCRITGAYLNGPATSVTYDAGVAQGGGSAYMYNCLFDDNHALCQNHDNNGAGYHMHGKAYGTFVSCTFANNAVDANVYHAGGAFGINANLIAQPVVLSSCVFSGNRVTYGTGVAGAAVYYGGGASVNFIDCTFTKNVANNAAHLAIGGPRLGKVPALISGCLFTEGRGYNAISLVDDGTQNWGGGAVVQIRDTHIIDHSSGGQYPLYAGGQSVSAYVSKSIINYNQTDTGYQIDITSGAMVIFEGANDLGKTLVNNGGSACFAGSNTLVGASNTAGVGNIVISSGASITLKEFMKASANGITVLEGGCVVNGAEIAAGTYTQITSANGSATAS